MDPIFFLLLLLTIPLMGFVLLQQRRLNPAVVAWILVATLLAVIYSFIEAVPPLQMLLYIVATFLSFKMLVAWNHLGPGRQLRFPQWCLFCYAWFGMNPRPFGAFPAPPLPDYRQYLIRGTVRLGTGWLLLNATAWLDSAITTTRFNFLWHLLYLVGLSLMLHFGLLNLSTGFLRRLGIPVGALFKDPIRARSLNEFWSRRWNLAFVELTTLAVTRPVKTASGAATAFWASFLFSGLLHELAISLPVRTGFGLPFAYFLLQAALILTIDRHLIKIKNTLLRTLVLMACLFLPIFLLFHPAFIQQIVLPLVGYLVIG